MFGGTAVSWLASSCYLAASAPRKPNSVFNSRFGITAFQLRRWIQDLPGMEKRIPCEAECQSHILAEQTQSPDNGTHMATVADNHRNTGI